MLRKATVPPAVREKLQLLLESQYWSYGQLREYQWRKLQDLLRHAYARVPFYRNLFDRHGLRLAQLQDFSDLARIPPLSKQLIREHFAQLRADNASAHNLYLEHTGGSTGEPLQCYQDQGYLSWAAAARIRAWKHFPGFDEHTREALLWGADQDVASTLTLRQIIAVLLSRRDLQLNTFNATDARFRRFAVLCSLLRPKIMRGYASSLSCFCDYLRQHGKSVPPPAAIISSAEVLTPGNRAHIEAVLRAGVFDSYGSRETGLLAMECRRHCGLHVAMEHNYVELDAGQVLVTSLNNYAMPLIRYAIGDRAEAALAEQCPCGRGLERLARIEGRTGDVLRFGDRIVHAEYISHLFYTDTPITRFQVIKNERQNRLKVLVDKPDKRLEQAVRQALEQKFPGTAIVIDVCQHFVKTKSGKMKIVVDENEA